MKLNKDKTKCVLFDLSKLGIKADLSHPITGEQIKIVEELKVLGFWLTSDLNFQKQVNERCKSARRCLWTLIRLREAHFPLDKLVKIYIMNIRSILEYSILVIFNSLTKQQMYQLESIQRKATQIILNNYEMSYDNSNNGIFLGVYIFLALSF